jgi:hypothetical protein
MKVEDVPDEWVDRMREELNVWPCEADLRAALAAVAPLLRRAALEEAAGVASSFDNGRFVYDGNGMLVPTRAGVKIAAAIRALDTKEAGV